MKSPPTPRAIPAGGAAEAVREAVPIPTTAPRRFPAIHPAWLWAALTVPVIGLFSIWTASSALAFPQALITLFVLVYLPGRLLLLPARLAIPTLDHALLSVTLGAIAVSLAYWALTYLNAQRLILMLPAIALVQLILDGRKRLRAVRDLPSIRPVHAALAGVLVVANLPHILTPMFFRTLDYRSDGAIAFREGGNTDDLLLHLSIAKELIHTVPPQVPFLPGLPLGYHYGPDLFLSLFTAVGRVNATDMAVRIGPLFFVVFTVLAVFVFGRLWFRSSLGAILLPLLVFFGEDFSFIPGILQRSASLWSTQYFQVPTTVPNYWFNPLLPAMGLLFLALSCVLRFVREERLVWLVTSVVMIAWLVECKAFASAQLLGVMAATSLLYLLCFRDGRLLKVTVAAAALTFPVALYATVGADSGVAWWVRLQPGDFLLAMMHSLGLDQTVIGISAQRLYSGAELSATAVVSTAFVVLPLYLVGSLGMRVLGIRGLLRAMFRPDRENPLAMALALFVVGGPIVTLLFTVTPRDYPEIYNNVVWFYVQSKHVAWIFAVGAILGLVAHQRAALRIAAVVAVLLLSVPSALQFFSFSAAVPTAEAGADAFRLLGQDTAAVVDLLQEECRHGEVVWANELNSRALLALTPCRVTAGPLFAPSFASRGELAQRRAHTKWFWASWELGQLRSDILQRYDVAFLLVDLNDAGARAGMPIFLSGRDAPGRVRVDRQPIFSSESALLFRVERRPKLATAILEELPPPGARPPASGHWIRVRWADSATPEDQTAVETRYQMFNPQDAAADAWEYDLRDTEPATVRALLADPLFAEVTSTLIHVRWAPSVDDRARADRERALGLRNPVNTEGRTFRYDLADFTTPALQAILADPAVEDTNGVNRDRYRKN